MFPGTLRRAAAAALAAALVTVFPAAQPATRLATTAEALVTFPLFFHGKSVAVHHRLTGEPELLRLEGTARPVYVFWRERPARTDGEIRGEFWDIGRFEEHDARFAGYDFRRLLDEASNGRWPPRERVFVLLGATVTDNPAPSAPGLRAIAMAPEQFEGREVTVVGRFRGANLFGDIPQGVGKSRYDFVIQSADAAIWVTQLRPRGRGFDLDPSRRVDTGRWVAVTGTVRREGALVWLEGRSLELSEAAEEAPVEAAPPVIPKQPAPEVIFSAPVQDDLDIAPDAPVRLQFSRDMVEASFRGAVRVRYTSPTAPQLPAFTATYSGGTRSLEIRFAEPLARFQEVRVDLLEGITAIDGQPLPAYSLTFQTGG